jgi:hypothetical protein
MPPKNPILIPSLGYRKAVVRHCVEHLREIDGRLDQGCGPRFESQLQNCDDLSVVAKMMLTLMKRVGASKGADTAWLEELTQLSPADVDERAIELTIKVKQGLRQLHAAVPYPRDPHQFLGAQVIRRGDGTTSAVSGQVVEHHPHTGFRVLYTDGDAEDFTMRDLQSVLLRGQPDPEPVRRMRMRRNGSEAEAPRGEASAPRACMPRPTPTRAPLAPLAFAAAL